METVRLLVQNTEDKEQVQRAFIKYAEQGKLVQTGVLLLTAPELVMPSCLSLRDGWARSHMLYKILNFKEIRTEIQEGLVLLLDAFAMIGHKLVAYIRLDLSPASDFCSIVTTSELAYLLREAIYDNQGVHRPDEYFLRFFKPVQGDINDMVKRENGGMEFVYLLGFELLRKNINLDYINSVIPTLKEEDAVRLTTSIEEKLSSCSSFRTLPQRFGIETTKGEELTRKEKQATGRTFWHSKGLFHIQRQPSREPNLSMRYSTIARGELMKQSKLKSLLLTTKMVNIISTAKRLVK